MGNCIIGDKNVEIARSVKAEGTNRIDTTQKEDEARESEQANSELNVPKYGIYSIATDIYMIQEYFIIMPNIKHGYLWMISESCSKGNYVQFIARPTGTTMVQAPDFLSIRRF